MSFPGGVVVCDHWITVLLGSAGPQQTPRRGSPNLAQGKSTRVLRALAQPWVMVTRKLRPRRMLSVTPPRCRGRTDSWIVSASLNRHLNFIGLLGRLIANDGNPGLRNVRFTHVTPPWARLGLPLRGNVAHRMCPPRSTWSRALMSRMNHKNRFISRERAPTSETNNIMFIRWVAQPYGFALGRRRSTR